MSKVSITARMILLCITLLWIPGLGAQLSYTELEYVEFGNTPIDNVLELYDGSFLSCAGNDVRVFTINGQDITFGQSVHSLQPYTSVRTSGNFIYAIDRYCYLDVYSYNYNTGLSLLSRSDFGDPVADLPLSSKILCFEAANGILVFENQASTFAGDTWIDRSIIDVRNPSVPVLMERTRIAFEDRFSGFYYLSGHYIYTGFNGRIYCSEQPSAHPDSLASAPNQLNIPYSAQLGDRLMLICGTNGQYFLAKLELNLPNSVQINLVADTGIKEAFHLTVESDSVHFLTGMNSSGVWQIERYVNTNQDDWALSNVSSYDASQYTLFEIPTGYIALGFYKSMILDASLNLISTINETVSYLFSHTIMNRYLILSVHASSITNGYKVFDLQTEEFLDFYSAGYTEDDDLCENSDKLVFLSDLIEVLEFGQNGISNFWTMPTPPGTSRASVAGDILALTGYSDGQWRVSLYTLTSSGSSLQSVNIMPNICANIGFYAQNYIYTNRYSYDDENTMTFYRIEADYSLAFVDEFSTNGTTHLIDNDRLIQPNNNGLIIDISNPDQPCLIGELSLPTYGGWGASFDGQGHYIVNDLLHAYVLDSDYQVLGYLLGANSWFYDAGAFISPGPTGFFKVAVDAIVATNDPHFSSSAILPVSNYPNPFSTFTNIRVSTLVTEGDRPEHPSSAILKIFNIKGQLVRSLELDPAVSGEQLTRWDGRDTAADRCANGIYFITLVVDGRCLGSKKVTLIR